MYWVEAARACIQDLTPVTQNAAAIERLYRLIDLTRLQEADSEENIIQFFAKADTPLGRVAAVCIYPQFVRQAVATFAATPIRIATVANFPQGNTSLEEVLIEINGALEDGAQEIDVVFPYQRYLAHEREYAQQFVSTCKAACGDQVLLKVILETGALADPDIIADASRDALVAGADFIKSSTGKIAKGVSLEAIAIMILVIRELAPTLSREIGIKVAGGIKDVSSALQYLALVEQVMGKNWVTPRTFRLGSSQLVDEILGV